ncbi:MULTISPECIES: ABC transporter permease [Dietzia]|uniref:ABC transporter permease n=1 Tax=Dietzia cinnamea TaxID=321318 RepID=A0ABV3YEM8_9ACTN|nr:MULTISPECIES: ABC transporter permease [Dietzia]AVM63601.1 ABC transporter permease [Dietzia sp. oral taxon 368]MCT2062474.1 ABC transporter permease [Dietzia cinnamea]MCT2098736.1 ABC transporter permease [Dietzia cinnamea]MCT2172820.1 ABC transporter permease [Dietzia cinnamea]MCT2235478.1 ABC transporter permease [Dietzia cinnamea]
MNLLKSEWIKVTTTKSAYWLYAIGIALAVLLAVIIGQFDQSATDPVAGEAGGGSDPLFAILGVSAFTVLLVWIAAIVGVTGEYRYHTAKATYLTTPSRWPAIVAKTVLFTILSIVVTAVSVIVALLVAGALSGNESWTPFSGDGLTYLWRFPVYAALGTLAVMGLAYIMRNAAGTISLFLVWILALEGMVSLIPKVGEDLAGWMPFANGDYWTQGEAAKGYITWGEWPAFALYAAVCVVLWGVGLVMTLRRDA